MALDGVLVKRSLRRVGRAPGRVGARLRTPTIVLVAVVAGFYAWTAGVTTPDNHDLQYYDNLADAFVHGRLDLRPSPPPGLLALPNPYDPGASQPYRNMGFHDLLLYKGKLYSDWGPTPAVVLFAPLRLLGIDLSHAVAAFLLAFAAWAFACGTLWFVVRRWLPGTPRWMLHVGAIVLAAGDLAPFLIRRPKVYEVAIVSGLCFTMGAAYFLATGALGRRISPWRLALGSLCVGLAAGSRPQLGIEAAALVLVAAVLWRQRGRLEIRWLAALAGPAAVCAGLLLAYNAARFGSPFSSGRHYQLSAVDSQTLKWASFSYLPPSLWWLVLSLPHLQETLPFTSTYSILVPRSYPGALPAGFSNPGPPIGGLLPTAPIVLLPLALLWVRGRAREALRLLRGLVATLFLVGLALMVIVAYLILPVERYAGDYTGLLVLAAVCAWVLLACELRDRPRARAATHLVAGALSAWTVYVGVVMSAPATIGH